MLFNSIDFIIFLPIALAAYWLAKGRARLWVCLIANLVFYGYWDWRFLVLLGSCTLFCYGIGVGMAKERDRVKRNILLIIGISVNVGLLAVLKYSNFFISSLVTTLALLGLNLDIAPLRIILPLGISFFTFRCVSYIIDVYRKQFPAELSLLRFSVFMTLFPLLLAGPIVRAATLLPQMYDSGMKRRSPLEGASLITWGFFKKIVIADSLSPIVTTIFAHPEIYTSLSLMIGAIFYAYQIYCDFSGYSDIAIGIGMIMGFDFGINFNRPYFSKSFSEFWARWHISLSSWLRDYLYVPLGGNRRGTLDTYKNIMITMLLCGLWHGPRWNFIVWGALHAVFLIGQRFLCFILDGFYFVNWVPAWFTKGFGAVTVFLGVCIGWIIFYSETLNGALSIIKGIASLDDLSFGSVPHRFFVVKGLCLIIFLFCLEASSMKISFHTLLERRPVFGLCAIATMIWTIALFGSFDGNSFIYLQF